MSELFWLAASMRAVRDAETNEQRDIATWWGVYEMEQLAKSLPTAPTATHGAAGREG